MNIFIYTYDPAPASYYKDGRKEYEKRLSRYCRIKHIACKNIKQLEKERAALMSQTDSHKNLLVFVESGSVKSEVDSVALSKQIDEAAISGISTLIFLIGFPEEDRDAFPGKHQLHSLSRMRMSLSLQSLILEEQIYRAYRILNREPYHK